MELKLSFPQKWLTSYRVESYDKDKNEEAMHLQLDLVDEVRAVVEQRLARY